MADESYLFKLSYNGLIHFNVNTNFSGLRKNRIFGCKQAY